ncbi:hypothetical protein MWF98_04855 [Fusobacterium necrophorum]|uniref:Uncharacterized protein n=1 Tax=Fusobacterium necrophorum DJ-2 TaxID=1441737 RepID=A0AB73C3H9_9FUSO|nr:hypothetical protein [Fusobacterium necrophorum]KDE64790.1 hypothetical protein FUSO4_07400 [Fusobacterium necrophorum DJ-1]KDE67335.1 hypothetical protein FUSO5_00260 [Fusobacterium necrophorum BFTR-1]KDE72504.1 hypothetical protein FUSO8_05025 [Fusobacterium necrophorum DJ-2]MBR8733561.1 hypothetical protein [Fusobacterium necrophorum]MBR8789789.1 hypothetical protein [Fusobacterium necrophorum]
MSNKKSRILNNNNTNKNNKLSFMIGIESGLVLTEINNKKSEEKKPKPQKPKIEVKP